MADVLHALSDPQRLCIVRSLAEDSTPRRCGSFDLDITKSTLTHHFRVLREAGVIAQEEVGTSKLTSLRREDLVGMIRVALEDERWSGPVNGTAPEPVTNRELSHALAHVLHRPSLLPVPGFALGLLYGEMAEIVTTGARVMPAKALVLGYDFRHPELDEALRSALG